MNPLVYFSFAFAFSEFLLMLLKRSGRSHVKARKDKGSLILLWMMITSGFAGGFIFSERANYFLAALGFVFIITGLIVRWIAIVLLGKSFTVDVAITSTANLKTDGIYKRIRHPSYLGILLIITGFSAAMGSFYSFLILVIPVFVAIVYRIKIEEELLITEFGEEYLNYMSVSKRLIPGIY